MDDVASGSGQLRPASPARPVRSDGGRASLLMDTALEYVASRAAGLRARAGVAEEIGASDAGGARAIHGTGTDSVTPGVVPGPAFDAHHPPDPRLIADCVHCGFCLPTCPTYLLWGEEMDSPRGRIYLMKMASENEIGLTSDVARHFDQCLGCMACVTACPSGVQYDKLLEATRQQVERRVRRPLSERLFRGMIFALFPHPGRLRALTPLLWLYQRSGARALFRSSLARRLPRRLRAMEAVMPAIDSSAMFGRQPGVVPARGGRRHRVGLLTGCVQRVFFARVNAATTRVLAAEGCAVVAPTNQGCCGALSFHAGEEATGLAYARRLIDAFDDAEVETVVVNAAGCGSALKEYGYLLRDDPAYAVRAAAFSSRVRDVAEFLAGLEPRAARQPLPLRVAYHDACHLGHAQGVRAEPRALLRGIPGLRLLDIAEADICCGSAGIYNLLEPVAAQQLGDRKTEHILAVAPDVIATGNPGCLLQIDATLRRRGTTVPLVHPIELVDASIRGSSPRAWFGRVGQVEEPAARC